MIIREINPHGYGMAFLSVDIFLEKVKDKKIRSAKFLSYFRKNMDVYFEFIKDGVIVPFNRVVSSSQPVFIEIEKGEFEIPQEYTEFFKYEDFFIRVGEKGLLSLMSFSDLDNKDMIKKNVTNRSYFTLDGKLVSASTDFEIPTGEWFFTMYGLRKKILTIDEKKYDQGYAYGFHFYQSDTLTNDNLEKCDDDKYNFGLYKSR